MPRSGQLHQVRRLPCFDPPLSRRGPAVPPPALSPPQQLPPLVTTVRSVPANTPICLTWDLASTLSPASIAARNVSACFPRLAPMFELDMAMIANRTSRGVSLPQAGGARRAWELPSGGLGKETRAARSAVRRARAGSENASVTHAWQARLTQGLAHTLVLCSTGSGGSIAAPGQLGRALWQHSRAPTWPWNSHKSNTLGCLTTFGCQLCRLPEAHFARLAPCGVGAMKQLSLLHASVTERSRSCFLQSGCITP